MRIPFLNLHVTLSEPEPANAEPDYFEHTCYEGPHFRVVRLIMDGTETLYVQDVHTLAIGGILSLQDEFVAGTERGDDALAAWHVMNTMYECIDQLQIDVV